MTLGTTTLLHESYIQLADREGLRFPDRAPFMAYAAKALRGLLIDFVRARRARKRGGEFQIVRLGDEEFAAPDSVADDHRLERLAYALAVLEKLDSRLAEVVDFDFFGGFSFTGIASLGERTPRTVQRDWRKARLLLQRLLTEE